VKKKERRDKEIAGVMQKEREYRKTNGR